MNSVFFFLIELCDFKTKNLYNCLFDSYFVFPLPLFRNEQMICSFIITYIKPKRVVLPPVIYLICMTISSTSLTLLRMTNVKPWVAVSLFKANSAHVGPNFSGRSMQSLGQVREALDVLSTMIKDVDVLVFFMIYSDPYSKHLLLDNCLFGRQVETECICPQFPVAHTFLWCWRTGGPAYCWSWQSR